MSTRHLLDPELHRMVDAVPNIELNAEILPAFRAARAAENVMADASAAGVNREEVHIPLTDAPDVRGLLYIPQQTPSTGQRAGYLHIHGGGYVMGSPEMSDVLNVKIASTLGCVVLSVDYRLAPEYSIPAPLDDCYAALGWLHEQAEALNVDRQRIGVGGESAGGGLAAALAILARDRGAYALCHQHLTYPMLDNLTGSTQQPGDPLVGEYIWTRERNHFGWTSYLGDAAAVAPQVPARVENYAGLPPTWMFTAALDLFRDENIHYAQQLLAAGVATELLVYPGACHGFQMLPGTNIGKRFAKDHLAALARGLSIESA